MAEKDESYYRRLEDQKWREKVDHEQVTLMTAVSTLQDQLRELKRAQKDNDATLRGEKGRGGLVSEYEKLDGLVTKLNAVVFQDSTGKHGLVHDVQELKSGDMSVERRWKYLTPIFIAVLSLAGSLILGWDRISKFLNPPHKPSVLEAKIERAKHKKGKPIVRYRYVVPTEDDENGTPDEVPQRRGGDDGGVE